eukprot:Partr_v1_DN25544_c0_g1_i3_m20780 putative Poly(ADP-ribose) polymerase and DNA-Ligase Zn-finger region
MYRIEQAKTGRSSCKAGKSCADKHINQGELRFGSVGSFNDHETVFWRHWTCVTPKILSNVGSPEAMEGYSTLPPEHKAMVDEVFAALANVEPQEITGTSKKKSTTSKKKEEVEVAPEVPAEPASEMDQPNGNDQQAVEEDQPKPAKKKAATTKTTPAAKKKAATKKAPAEKKAAAKPKATPTKKPASSKKTDSAEKARKKADGEERAKRAAKRGRTE